ncbi:M48 family metalloprotease [Pseudomonas sp. 9Ag]|uniref:M48 family metalloprotease n=1 Tax=Pseudomonas sp. 9Ag TaxID=2653167 RepID=UPI0012F0A8FA|nr:M48 family metalloprotease [Pseudomonas sp. 9Ag]VXC49475.1 hypothetical protein PSEUDO9AG_40034 [Pseudomonas sp. 9Ag]
MRRGSASGTKCSLILILILILILLIGGGVSPVFGDDEADTIESMQDTMDAGQRTLDLLMEKFRPVVEEEAPELYRTEAVRVEAVADFNAFANDSNKSIVVPLGFVAETFFQARALMQTYDENLDPRLYQEYMKYLSERGLESRKKGYSLGFNDFWLWAGINKPCCINDQHDYQYRARLEGFMIDALAFPLAHEIGHVALRHKKYSDISPSVSRQQEHEADKYALGLMSDTGLGIQASILTQLPRFDLAERSMEFPQNTKPTHPSTACRIEFLTRDLFEQIESDPQKKADFNGSSSMSIDEVRDYFYDVMLECESDDLYMPE